jgi:hypothetical protein
MEFSIQSLLSAFYNYPFVLYDWSIVIFYCTVDLHLSRLIGTASHLDMMKIRIIGFFFENRLNWQFAVRLLLSTVCTCVWTFRPRLIWSSRTHNTVLYLMR